MSAPHAADLLRLLDLLDGQVADDLESEFLDFKPWQGPKEDLKVACEYAACFANAGGGVVVFGVADRVRGRTQAIHGLRGHDLDVFRRGIFDGTRPGVAAEVFELDVPEGTGKLLVVRVAEGDRKPYGTAAGLFKQRVGKNCMPLGPVNFQRAQVRSAAVDWSGAPAVGVALKDLDPLQIENTELRELLELGNSASASASAQVEASRYLRKWSQPDGFLDRQRVGKTHIYTLRPVA